MAPNPGPQVVTLRSARLRAEVLPGAAGGLARLDWLGGSAAQPVLRPWTRAEGGPLPGTSQLACFPLLPWSNRIDPRGFVFDGRTIAPAPNRPGEPCPIHGDGWQHPWRVAAQSTDSVTLLLDRGEGVPFSYRARLRYLLGESALDVALEVTNTGQAALPFGLGLHPWLPRRLGVTLQAHARGTWTRGPLGLPLDAIGLPAAWDFAAPRTLPEEGVDHAFRGWDGRAMIRWPDTGLALEIAADMAYFILYAPAGKDFFCFEPVDHAINAHNVPGGVPHNGLTVLAPGASLERRVAFRVHGPSLEHP